MSMLFDMISDFRGGLNEADRITIRITDSAECF